MILVDSFGWIAFLSNGPLADRYAKLLDDVSAVITPTIIIYEVYKKVRREQTEEEP